MSGKREGSKPDEGEEPERDESEKVDAATDVIDAVKAEDADALAAALERFVMCCNDEGE